MGPVDPPGGRGVAPCEERLSLPSGLAGRAGQSLRAPTWFLACLYRVCFRASESKAELRASLTSNASSAALRRSSPFPKVGTGSRASGPPARCRSTHLHQRPGDACGQPGRLATPRGRLRACMPQPRAQGDRHTDTWTPGQKPHRCRKWTDRGPRGSVRAHVSQATGGSPGSRGQEQRGGLGPQDPGRL